MAAFNNINHVTRCIDLKPQRSADSGFKTCWVSVC